MKKAFSLILALIMALSVIPMTVFAATPDEAEAGPAADSEIVYSSAEAEPCDSSAQPGLADTGAEAELADTGAGEPEITGIEWNFDSSHNLIVSWDGFANTTEYVVNLYQYTRLGNNWVRVSESYKKVKNESENEKRFTTVFGGVTWDGVTPAGKYSNKFWIDIKAYNRYDERIAYSAYKEDITADFIHYLDPVQNEYFSKDFIFCFDPVPNAAYYRIYVSYGTATMLNDTYITSPFIDLSEFARDGDTYRITVTSFPPDHNKYYTPTHNEFYMSANDMRELGGSAEVNDDYTVTYGGFLKYLNDIAEVELSTSWQAYYKNRWISIPESRKWNYNPTLLRVTVTAEGYDGSVVSNDNRYTNKDMPYYATSFGGLKSVFNQKRENTDRTVYIKLANDISIDTSENVNLAANGADVDLDLCGYTLSATTSYRTGSGGAFDYDKNYITSFIGTKSGVYAHNTIHIRDSRRYDSSKGQFITGKIRFAVRNTGDGDTFKTYVLTNSVVLHSGRIINDTHSSSDTRDNYAYMGDSLKMYDGTLEADTPIFIDSVSSYFNKGYGVFGGHLYVKKGDFAIKVRGTGEMMPMFYNFTLHNDTGNSRVGVFDFNPFYNSSDVARSWSRFSSMFPTGTAAYIDGVKQSDVLYGCIWNGRANIQGPAFSDTYELVIVKEISEVEIDITKPYPYYDASYDAYVPSEGGYKVMTDYSGANYRNGVLYRSVSANADMTPGFTLMPGEKYWVSVILESRNEKYYQFASSVTATVNGEPAMFYKSGGYYHVDWLCDTGKAVVNNIEITTSKPRAGQPVRYIANFPEGAHYKRCYENAGNWENGICWLCEDTEIVPNSGTKFKAGKWYTCWVGVTVSDKELHYFADRDVITITVNGQKPTIVNWNETLNAYYIAYDCYCPYPQIDTLEVTVAQPKAGELITYDSSVPYDMGYEVPDYNNGTAYESGVCWLKNGVTLSPQDDHYFEAGQKYTVMVLVDIADSYYFEFDGPMNMRFYINDRWAINTKVNDERYSLMYTFTVPENSGKILGDADGDGELTTLDATVIQRLMAGMSVGSYDAILADADGDSVLTIIDATEIQRYLADMPTQLNNIGKSI